MMKVVLYMAMSVNGYAAKENDDTPWSDGEWKNYAKMVKKAGNLIVGRRTYEIMKKANEFEKIGNPFVVVVSHENKNEKGAVFVKSPKDAVKLLNEKGFKMALVGGGGKLNMGFMKENLIDQIYIDIEPVVFGNGVKLFDEGDFESKLELIGVRKISKNEIQLHYNVRK